MGAAEDCRRKSLRCRELLDYDRCGSRDGRRRHPAKNLTVQLGRGGDCDDIARKIGFHAKIARNFKRPAF